MAIATDTLSAAFPQRESADEDPHPVWFREVEALRQVMADTPKFVSDKLDAERDALVDRLGARRDALVDRIIDTPARTGAGALAQARVASFDLDPTDEAARAIAACVATLERLAEDEASRLAEAGLLLQEMRSLLDAGLAERLALFNRLVGEAGLLRPEG